MSEIKKLETEEESSACSEQAQPQTGFDRFRHVVREWIGSVFCQGKKSEQVVFSALRETDLGGKLEIIDGLIERRQGELVMRCLQSFPEIDPNGIIQKMINSGQSAVVIFNQFRIYGRLDETTNAMVDREYYRLAPFMFPFA